MECGTVLEQAGERFGAITRHWGAVKYRLAFIGRQAHTGPTPMAERQDALLGAAHLITAIGALPGRAEGTLHSSVGRLEVQPNSPNVVPGEAVLFIELRSPEQSVLDWAEREMLAAADDGGRFGARPPRDPLHRPAQRGLTSTSVWWRSRPMPPPGWASARCGWRPSPRMTASA